MTTEQSPTVSAEGPQLDKSRRLYVEGKELAAAKAAKVQIYIGPRRGTYVDLNQDWVNSHTKEHGPQTLPYNNIDHPNMHPVPKHGPDVVLYENDEYHPQGTPPKDADGKNIKPKKDSLDNLIYKERNFARPLNADKRRGRIPHDATDVHIASDPKQDVQAIFTTKAGKRKALFTAEFNDAVDKERWANYSNNEEDLIRAVNKLNRMDIGDMNASHKL